jgi:hypothetical protein
MILSFRLYSMILTPIAKSLEQIFNINILSNLLRVVATLTLSVAAYLLIIHFAKLVTPDWMVAIPVLHGLTVGLMWESLARPGGLQLGVDIQ